MTPELPLIHLRPGGALFFGSLPDLPLHRHAAAALVFAGSSAGKLVLVDRRGRRIQAGSALIPPFVYHGVVGGPGPLGALYLDPGSGLFRLWSGLREIEAEPRRFREDLEFLLSGESTVPERAGEFLIRIFGAGDLTFDGIDPRIRKVMRAVQDVDPERKGDVAALAQLAGLSASRLIHLFSQEVGAPLRRYRAWHRIKAAVVALAQGMDLTGAAHAAGFYDSAHFSRSFKGMFGMPPSWIFQKTVSILFGAEGRPVRLTQDGLTE